MNDNKHSSSPDSDRKENAITDEWASVNIPYPPELRPVTIEPAVTALMILDVQNQNCNLERRPRCVASIPKIKSLLTEFRNKGMPVIYSLTSNADTSDIRQELTPAAGDPIVKSGVDKFFGTELETILLSRNIQSVILTGTSAHGAVIHTAVSAALRTLKVIVPVDAVSADDLYAEQYTAWHLANSPGSRKQVTLTRTGLISF